MRSRISIAALVLSLSLAAVVQAAPNAAAPSQSQAAVQTAPQPIERRVVILYNSATGQSATNNLVSQGYQTVLNYYGLLPEYVDISQRPLPDAIIMDGVRAIIVALNSSAVEDVVPYLQWVLNNVDDGKRLVIVGELGSSIDRSNQEANNIHSQIYSRLGLRFVGDLLRDRTKLQYGSINNEITGFERSYPDTPPMYSCIVPIGKETVPIVTVLKKDNPSSASSVVAFSSIGGVVLPDYAYWEDPLSFQHKWYIDPFAFLSRRSRPSTWCKFRCV